MNRIRIPALLVLTGEYIDRAPVADRLIWMWAVEATCFQDNTDSGSASLSLSRAPLTAAQLAFTFQWIASCALAAGYFYTAGGQTRIDSLSQDNALQTRRYPLSGFLARADQIGDPAIRRGFVDRERLSRGAQAAAPLLHTVLTPCRGSCPQDQTLAML